MTDIDIEHAAWAELVHVDPAELEDPVVEAEPETTWYETHWQNNYGDGLSHVAKTTNIVAAADLAYALLDNTLTEPKSVKVFHVSPYETRQCHINK